MWKSRTRPQAVAAPSKAAAAPAIGVVNSVGRPYATLTLAAVAGRGFALTITDATAREIQVPSVPSESIARALEGSPVTFRHAGHSVEMTPLDGFVRIRCAHPGGPTVEGTFKAEDIERAVRLNSL